MTSEIGTVSPDGTVDFAFQEIAKTDVPAAVVVEHCSQALVDQCFDGNCSLRPSKPVTCAQAAAPCPAK